MIVEPAMNVISVDSHDVVATVHVNTTAPGTIMCSYYSSTVRPLFEERAIHHAGHAHLLLKNLEEEMAYTVECSLNHDGVTIQTEKVAFTTKAHTQSHLTISDIETYSTFARVSIKSETPGEVLCFHRPHGFKHGLGHGLGRGLGCGLGRGLGHNHSFQTFKNFAKRLYVHCIILLSHV